MRRTEILWAALAMLVLSACHRAEPGAAPSWSAWSSYAGSNDSAQFSSLKQINRENVAELEVAWTFDAGTTPHRLSPLVIDGTIFVATRGGVSALHAATGEERWHAADAIAQYLRGLAYWQNEAGTERWLMLVKGHELRALNADTGAPIADFAGDGKIDLRENLGRDPQSITRVATMTPGRVFENLFVVGSAVGDETYGGAPGDIRAFDVRTGELVWKFHTIPHPGEFGYDSWPKDAWKSIGAANAWSTMALDEARGIIFVPTGAPSYHFYGANRPGDNLFANSLIALDVRTGERLWHFQAVHHDIWDYDLAMGPKLLTVARNGELIDAVVIAGKHGYLYVFDRETGEAVYPIEERPVPASDVPGEVASPTQPFPTGLPSFANLQLSADELSPHADAEEVAALAGRIGIARNEGLYTPPSFRGSVNAPGSRGGAQHGNGAVDPASGMFYMAVINSPTIPKLEDRKDFFAEHYEQASAAEIYLTSCAACHGVLGQGQPPLFPSLQGISERMNRAQFADVLKQGKGRMAAFPNMPAEQVSGLWSHIGEIRGSAEAAMEVPSRDATPGANAAEHRYRSGYHHFFTSDGLLGPLPWSSLLAYDLNNGRIVWEEPYGDVVGLAARGVTATGSLFPTNSLAATAGGLLFSVTNDQRIRAWNRDTGEVLWSAALPADPGGIPAIYEVDGRQYVVAAATRDDRSTGGRYEFAYIAYALPETVD